MLQRIFDSRAEIIMLVNAVTVALGLWGFEVSQDQQVAVQAVVNAVLLLGVKLLGSASSVSTTTAPLNP